MPAKAKLSAFPVRAAVVALVLISPVSTRLGGLVQTRVVVRTSGELSVAAAKAKPGTTIAMVPGIYEGGVYIHNLSGTASAPIVIEAANPADPPIIRGGDTGFQLSDVAHLTVRRLIFENQREIGINIDDGDSFDTPSHHINVSQITIRKLQGGGASAAIKMAGVQDFVVEASNITEWGGGSAITMIGSHRGLVRGNVFTHRDDAAATGVQMKGGSTAITVRENRFEHAGLRAVQIGGTTGDEFFRPQPRAAYEARDCVVERNVFIGSEATAAFVNVDGSSFQYNTVYRPKKWLLRILQESTRPGFVPSRSGVVTGNIIYFAGNDFPFGAINAGDGVDAASFRFERNWWYRADRPNASRQQLPSAEIGAVYGQDPGFVNAVAGDFHLITGSPASAFGAYARSES